MGVGGGGRFAGVYNFLIQLPYLLEQVLWAPVSYLDFEGERLFEVGAH